MLTSLHIENIAVIAKTDIQFTRGFNVLSGETGAGKSIIVDSINLLLGNRFSKELIRTGESYALVNAVFENLSPEVLKKLEELGFSIDDGMLMLQKKVQTDGKSSTRLNGQIITNALQKQIATLLLSIHGQSDSQRLLQKSSHLAMVDAYSHNEALLADYQTTYTAWKAKHKELTNLSTDEAQKRRWADMYEYQIKEIEKGRLNPGEAEKLKKEQERLENIEEINRYALTAGKLLAGDDRNSALSQMKRAASALTDLSSLVDGVEPIIKRLNLALSEVEDIGALAEGFGDEDCENPSAKIDKIEERLRVIRDLEQKYGASEEEVLVYADKAREKLNDLNFTEEKREAITEEIKHLEKEMADKAKRLTENRQDNAKKITKAVVEKLAFLDMPKVRFDVGFEKSDWTSNGNDDVEFLIATNPGEPLQPLMKIASGGELSRIMLALRSVLDDREGADTVIFDEIDTGISGKTSRKVGIQLKEIGQKCQVLCVTHSAQIASLADSHLLIAKTEREGRAYTTVTPLSYEDRVNEIARILGGIDITDTQRAVAKEMMDEYR